jgi:hypothetical protein
MSSTAKSTQDFVDIKEIRDGVVTLKDGSMRAVVMSSSINFALKSEENQAATLAQFQNFLNTLDFSVQISVESRRLNIAPYLALLEERYKKQTTNLMKIQVREYVDFVKDFTENVNIMTKNFFIVIPFGSAAINMQKGMAQSLTSFLPGGSKNDGEMSKEDLANQHFEERKIQLQQRVAVVDQGLMRMGLRAVRLGSDELVELYYKVFNPGDNDNPIIPKS